jgi:hypothetical protein
MNNRDSLLFWLVVAFVVVAVTLGLVDLAGLQP